MFSNYAHEFKHFRLIANSNEMSTSFNIEELDTKPSVGILNLYFYFFGNEKLDISNLIKLFETDWSELTYGELRNKVLDFLNQNLTGNDYSYSEKEVSVYAVRPKRGTCIRVKGKDFGGRLFWDSFFFVSNKKDVCLCTDAESAVKIFYVLSQNPIDSDLCYENLIKSLQSNGIKIYGDV